MRLSLRSGEIREACGETLNTILDHVKVVIENIPAQLTADVFENGLTLCGGVALMPGIDRFFAEKLSIPVKVAEDPALCVCRGTESILESPEDLLQVVSADDD